MRDSRSRTSPKRSSAPLLASKKTPKQARSKQLVADILEAAIRVLRRDGAAGFTTVRVAEETGVSVGSLYQYFPNKESLLFRLQADEWTDTGSILTEILVDRTKPPLERLRRAIKAFFRSEREEAPLREALDAAIRLARLSAPENLIHTTPEAIAHRREHARVMLGFIEEALPSVAPEERSFVARFLPTSLSAVAERITREPLLLREIDAWARATADAHCGYLEDLERRAQEKG